jgi:hypothetical protein
MSLTAFIGLLAALVALAIDLALWIIVRNRLQDRGYDADLVSVSSLSPILPPGLLSHLLLLSRLSIPRIPPLILLSLISGN